MELDEVYGVELDMSIPLNYRIILYDIHGNKLDQLRVKEIEAMDMYKEITKKVYSKDRNGSRT